MKDILQFSSYFNIFNIFCLHFKIKKRNIKIIRTSNLYYNKTKTIIHE